MSENEIERLSRKLHSVYQEEARRQAAIGADAVRHPDAYDSLPEHTKDYDRALARFILQRETDLRDALASLRQAGSEFLEASEAAAKPMHSSNLAAASARWARTASRLRSLIGGIALANGSRVQV